MKVKVLLRIAAILMLLHAFGHTLGALTWKKAPNARVAAVVNGMQNERFNFMGRLASIGDFYTGYGITMIGVLLLLVTLLWILSTEPNPKFILAVGLFLLFMGIAEIIWFFPFAAAFSLASGIITLIAYKKS